MIRNPRLLMQWELEQRRRERPDYFQNLAIFEAMYKHAQVLNALPTDDPLVGIEAKIDFAARIHVPTTAGEDGPGA